MFCMICSQTTFLPHVFIQHSYCFCKVCEWWGEGFWKRKGTSVGAGGVSSGMEGGALCTNQKRSHFLVLFFYFYAARFHYFVFNECRIEMSVVAFQHFADRWSSIHKWGKKSQWNISWFLYEHIMGCPVCVHVFVPPVPSSAVARRIWFLSPWLRTKPMCLVIVQSVIFLHDGLCDLFFSPRVSFMWRRCRVHAECTVWKWSLSLGDNILKMPL